MRPPFYRVFKSLGKIGLKGFYLVKEILLCQRDFTFVKGILKVLNIYSSQGNLNLTGVNK